MNQVADTPPTGPRKVEWALLLTIVLGGAILRFVNIGLESFWYDEIHSLMKALNHPNQNTGLQILLPATDFFNQYLAWQPLDVSSLVEMSRQDFTPPLYYATLNVWIDWFGTSELAVRSLSALCSLLLPIPIYVLGRSQGGHQLGLWAALVTALSPFQIYYGQEARVYSMAALMAAVCSLCVWRFLFGAKPVASGLLYSICAIVGVFSHYAFLFLLPFHGGWALFEMWRRPQRRHWMVVVPIVSMGLALTAWYPVLEAQQDFMALSSPFFEGRVGLLETFSMLARIPLRLVAGDNLWSKLVYASLIGGLALASVSAWRRWVDEWRAVWFATCWVLTPLTLHMAADLIVGNHTVTVTRYSMLISPGVYLLVGFGLASLEGNLRPKSRAHAVRLVAGIMLGIGVGSVWYPSPLRYGAKSGMRELVQYLGVHLSERDLVVVNGPQGSGRLVAYYLKEVAPGQRILFWTKSGAITANLPLPSPDVFEDIDRVWYLQYRSTERHGATDIVRSLESLYPRVQDISGAGRRLQLSLFLRQVESISRKPSTGGRAGALDGRPRARAKPRDRFHLPKLQPDRRPHRLRERRVAAHLLRHAAGRAQAAGHSRRRQRLAGWLPPPPAGCFRHQLLLPRPYLVLTKPLRLDIQCQRGASVKIGWKYLDD